MAGNTLVSASSLDKAIEGKGGNKTAARAVGKLVAERCKAKGIDTVVFDRGGYVITVAWPSWPRCPRGAAWNSKRGG